MRQSQLFTRVERTFPRDEVALNAKLLTRAGFVRKLSAGVYAYLPLGLRVIKKISQIVREEMDAIGGEELLLSALVDKKYLDATKRWDLDVGFEAKTKNEKQAAYALGWTHEEVLAAIASKSISSYKDLPFAAYQIQTKFRNELRAQSGLLRGREFLMKDLYSFHVSQENLFDYYAKVKEAYFKVFERCGLKAYYTLAGGGDFTLANTHEFQVIVDVGEDTILLCKECGYAENKEISKLKSNGKCPECNKGKVSEEKAIEVGNIFPLGTKYAEAFGLEYVDNNGNRKPVVMGSYGIGISRVMGTIAEIKSDAEGLIWPESVAPFRVHLLALNGAEAKNIYADLQKAGVEVLYDDRDMSAGEKLVESSILGVPFRAVVSPKTEGKIELKKRSESETRLVNSTEFLKIIHENIR